jgi:hypothetical protein
MEQQQNELFAMIGQLMYKLQLVQRENERLVDENETKTETCARLLKEYNTHFVVSDSLRKENDELKEKIATVEAERNSLERSIGLGRPQRDNGDDNDYITADELMNGYYREEDEMADEHVRWMYTQGFMNTDEEPYPEWA